MCYLLAHTVTHCTWELDVCSLSINWVCQSLIVPQMYFSFIEYICIIDVFTYFNSTASVVKGGIYVLPQHTEQLPNESLSSFALKHQRMIMTAPGTWWIQFILHVQGCTVNRGTVSHHSGELASTWGFYAITTSLSLYFISSECQFTVFSKEFTPFLVTSITSSSFATWWNYFALIICV